MMKSTWFTVFLVCSSYINQVESVLTLEECQNCQCVEKEHSTAIPMAKRQYYYKLEQFRNQSSIADIPTCFFQDPETTDVSIELDSKHKTFCQIQGNIFSEYQQYDGWKSPYIGVVALNVSNEIIPLIPTFNEKPKQPMWYACQIKLQISIEHETITILRIDALACPTGIYGYTFLKLVDDMQNILGANLRLIDESSASFFSRFFQVTRS